MRTGADYIQGVWVRLNGGGRRLAGIAGLPQGLQMPPVNKEARAAATKALSLEISSLEKRLQESSKVSLMHSCLTACHATISLPAMTFAIERG